jgi:segregation and condensation protein B
MVTTTIEAILFAAAKPIQLSHLSKNLELSKEVVKEAVADIARRFNSETSGIHVLEHGGAVQFVTNPQMSEGVKKFLKKESSGPLTRPSLETLTVIAYRGPITKPELEIIRGVNCSLIIRNLLIRGYITEEQSKEHLQPIYTLSNQFLQALGTKGVEELPNYESFNSNEKINELLNAES